MLQNTNKYRRIDVSTANQGRLIVMLYDGILRQIDIAERELESAEPSLDTVHNALTKVQEILTELQVSLDLEQGGEIAFNLQRLYYYFNKRLREANLEKSAAPLREIRPQILSLRDAWSQVQNEHPEQSSNLGVDITS